MRNTYFVITIIVLISSATALPPNQLEYAVVKTPKRCAQPYEMIGSQCLYFSRPYQAWGITGTWSQAYKSFYDAAVFCLENGGYLAETVEDVEAAMEFCRHLKGSCTPSLIARNGKCYQWSPLDGKEMELPCNTENLKARFICEQQS